MLRLIVEWLNRLRRTALEKDNWVSGGKLKEEDVIGLDQQDFEMGVLERCGNDISLIVGLVNLSEKLGISRINSMLCWEVASLIHGISVSDMIRKLVIREVPEKPQPPAEAESASGEKRKREEEIKA